MLVLLIVYFLPVSWQHFQPTSGPVEPHPGLSWDLSGTLGEEAQKASELSALNGVKMTRSPPQCFLPFPSAPTMAEYVSQRLHPEARLGLRKKETSFQLLRAVGESTVVCIGPALACAWE